MTLLENLGRVAIAEAHRKMKRWDKDLKDRGFTTLDEIRDAYDAAIVKVAELEKELDKQIGLRKSLEFELG